ncbi:MAG: SatD family protein [Rhodoglobus sp.]
MTSHRVALLVDIVGSRDIADRAHAQDEIISAFAHAQESRRVEEPLWPTAGDEFQAVFETVSDALAVTAIARLFLPQSIDCRQGLGQGEIVDIGQTPSQRIQDGSAWWRAREAINEAHKREDRGSSYVRTWFVSAEPETEFQAIVNSYLLTRDHAIHQLKSRERRIAAGLLLGHSQSAIAQQEKITQSAVSQSIQRSGVAAMLAAHRLLEGIERS